jgi:hypothetical protein
MSPVEIGLAIFSVPTTVSLVTLLLGRRKVKAETDDIISTSYSRLIKDLRSEFDARLRAQSERLDHQDKRIAEQDAIIAIQNIKISSQDKIIEDEKTGYKKLLRKYDVLLQLVKDSKIKIPTKYRSLLDEKI